MYEYYLKIECAMSPNTVASYISDLTAFFSAVGKDPKNVVPEDIISYFAETTALSKRSQARVLSSLHSFYKWMIMEGEMTDNPSDAIEAPKLGKYLPAVLSVEEVDRLIAAVDLDSAFGKRDRATIERLKKLEDGGALVVNSAYGIDNCVRQQMTELLVANEVPHPRSFIISTDEKFTPSVFPCWIKRGNSHAMVKEDVVYVECREEAEVVMADFRKRNIPVAVVNEHLVGDLVKFYGVQGTDFFYTFYPTEQSHSKFGLEAINGATRKNTVKWQSRL